jgi:hypothetical protein
MIIRNTMHRHTMLNRKGNIMMIRSRGFEDLNTMHVLIIHNRIAMNPAIKGEIIQDKNIPPSPATDQSTQSPPTHAMVMPAMPPTMACVVETGSLVYVARSKNKLAAISAANIPT